MKEAADEAKERIDIPPVITLGDIKTLARETGTKKWQDMWEKSEKGRHLFNYRPKVDHKIKTLAIRTTVVPIRILIRTTVVPIRILIRTTGITNTLYIC